MPKAPPEEHARRLVQRQTRQSVGRASLRPEDLAEIDSILRGADLRVHWVVGRYEYGNLELLQAHETGPLVEIEAYGFAGDMQVAFLTSARGATVWLADADSITLLGIAAALRAVVRRRQNLLQRLSEQERIFVVQFFFVVVLASISGAWLLVIGRGLPGTFELRPEQFLAFLPLLVGAAALSGFDQQTGRITGRMRVYLHADEDRGWLSRHADAIVPAIVGAIVGSVATFLLTRLAGS